MRFLTQIACIQRGFISSALLNLCETTYVESFFHRTMQTPLVRSIHSGCALWYVPASTPPISPKCWLNTKWVHLKPLRIANGIPLLCTLRKQVHVIVLPYRLYCTLSAQPAAFYGTCRRNDAAIFRRAEKQLCQHCASPCCTPRSQPCRYTFEHQQRRWSPFWCYLLTAAWVQRSWFTCNVPYDRTATWYIAPHGPSGQQHAIMALITVYQRRWKPLS